MSDKVELSDLRVPRDEDGEILPEYIKTDFGELGIKPLSLGDIERYKALQDKDDEEAETNELLSILKDIVLDPDLSSVDDDDLKDNYRIKRLRKALETVVADFYDVEVGEGTDTKN